MAGRQEGTENTEGAWVAHTRFSGLTCRATQPLHEATAGRTGVSPLPTETRNGLFLFQFQISFSKCLTNQSHGFGATEVVVTGI